jgi:hypothetical protein
VFDDDFIDAYIELKMTEVERFENAPASGRVRHILFAVIFSRGACLAEITVREMRKAFRKGRLLFTERGREPIPSERSADVRFGAHSGLKSDLT